MTRAKKTGTRGSRKGRGKSESETGMKAGEVEVRTGELTLGEPVELESNDVQMHIKAIKAATEKKDTANNLLRGCYKAANKLNPNLGDAIKRALTVERKNDPAALKAELEVFGIALKETGSPIQLVIHDMLSGDVAESAYKRGEADGKAGRTASNKYPEGSDLANEYARGWRHGTSANLGLTPEQSDEAVREDDDELFDPKQEGAGDRRALEHAH
jgi:hypothetical protein